MFPVGSVPIVELVDGVETWTYRPLTANDIAPSFSVSATFTGTGVVELGATVAAVSVAATYPHGAATAAMFTDGTHTNTLASPYEASTLTNGGAGYHSTTNTSFNFVLSALDGTSAASTASTLTFTGRIYDGLSTLPGSYDSAFVNSLPNSSVKGNASGSYPLPTGTDATYWYLVVPVADPQPTTFTSGGFTFPVSVVATGVAVMNPNGVAVPCNIIQSQGPAVVAQTVVVS